MATTTEPAGRTIDDDEALLARLLEAVIAAGDGEDALELQRRSVTLAIEARAGDEGAADALAELVSYLLGTHRQKVHLK